MTLVDFRVSRDPTPHMGILRRLPVATALDNGDRDRDSDDGGNKDEDHRHSRYFALLACQDHPDRLDDGAPDKPSELLKCTLRGRTTTRRAIVFHHRKSRCELGVRGSVSLEMPFTISSNRTRPPAMSELLK